MSEEGEGRYLGLVVLAVLSQHPGQVIDARQC
jgi:hypothetical protein